MAQTRVNPQKARHRKATQLASGDFNITLASNRITDAYTTRGATAPLPRSGRRALKV